MKLTDPAFVKAVLALAVLTALVLVGKVEAAAVVTFIGGLFMERPVARESA